VNIPELLAPFPPAELAAGVGVTYSTACRWRRGRTIPPAAYLIPLAVYTKIDARILSAAVAAAWAFKKRKPADAVTR
jgi:transcriptional regulator with XRE-family HTH domain